MVEEGPSFDQQRAHRWFAVEANNLAWDLLERAGRSAAETERMLHAAHAACFHWLAVGTPLNHLRALVLLSAASLAAGQRETAVVYGQQGVELLGRVADATAFDRATAFAAVAVAVSAVSGRRTGEIGAAVRQARAAADGLTDPHDRDTFARLFPIVAPRDGKGDAS
ncbi:MAG TPA: hypothetical protein VF595_05690 [Tepidisphaeraceae bacterium]|jgi:hypothetical protein